MAGSINFGDSRADIHSFAAGADAIWEQEQRNLLLALDNVANIGRDGIHGSDYGFSADSPEDTKKVLGLLAGWLRYKGVSDNDIFEEVGAHHTLNTALRQGEMLIDDRNNYIKEFHDIFTGRNNQKRAEALAAIVRSMGEYEVEAPDISREIDRRRFESFVTNARINGFIADSLSVLFSSPEDMTFRPETMDAFWQRLHISDIDEFNKTADYTKIHRNMAKVAEGFLDIAENEHFADDTELTAEDIADNKNISAALNYVDQFGKYNVVGAKYDSYFDMNTGEMTYNFITKNISPEFAAQFDEKQDAVNDPEILNGIFKSSDRTGIEAGKNDNVFRSTNSLDPYIMNLSDIDILNTLLGTNYKERNEIVNDIARIHTGSTQKSLKGKTLEQAADAVRESFYNGEYVTVIDEDNKDYSNIRVLNVDENAHKRESRNNNDKKTEAKRFFNSLLGTKDLDTRKLVQKLKDVIIDGYGDWVSKKEKNDITALYDRFKRYTSPENARTDLNGNRIEPNVYVLKDKEKGIREKIIMSFPGRNQNDRKFLNELLDTRLNTNAEIESEMARIRIDGESLSKLTEGKENKISEAVDLLKRAYDEKKTIDILPPEKGKFTQFKPDFKVVREREQVQLSDEKPVTEDKHHKKHHSSHKHSSHHKAAATGVEAKTGDEAVEKNTEEAKTEEKAKTEEVKTEAKAKTEEVKTEEVKTEAKAKTEEVKTEEVKTEEKAKTEEVKTEEKAKTEEVKTEEVKTDNNIGENGPKPEKEVFDAENHIIALSARDNAEKCFCTITGISPTRLEALKTGKTVMDLDTFLGRKPQNSASGTAKKSLAYYFGSIYINGKNAIEKYADGVTSEAELTEKWNSVMNGLMDDLRKPENTVAYIPDKVSADPDKNHPHIVLLGAKDFGFKMDAEKNDKIMKSVEEHIADIKEGKFETGEATINKFVQRAEAERAAAEQRRLEEARERARIEREENERRIAAQKAESDRNYYKHITENDYRPDMNYNSREFYDGISVLERLSGLPIHRMNNRNSDTSYGSDMMRAADRIYINGVPSRMYFDIPDNASQKTYEKLGLDLKDMLEKTLINGTSSGYYVMFKPENSDKFVAFTHTEPEPVKPQPVEKYGFIRKAIYSKKSVDDNERDYNNYVANMETYNKELADKQKRDKISATARAAASSIRDVEGKQKWDAVAASIRAAANSNSNVTNLSLDEITGNRNHMAPTSFHNGEMSSEKEKTKDSPNMQ